MYNIFVVNTDSRSTMSKAVIVVASLHFNLKVDKTILGKKYGPSAKSPPPAAAAAANFSARLFSARASNEERFATKLTP